jgi:two-component system, cell cycle response regulator CpdR
MKQLMILYVEDNKQLRDTICELLESDKRMISACASAEEALTALSVQQYDVVVTDISLPGLSGTELTRRVISSRPDQWVVLCSGYQLPTDLSKLGANVRSLVKPFEISDLDAILDEIAAAMQRIESGRNMLI